MLNKPEEKEIEKHWDKIWEKHNNKSQQLFEKIFYFIFRNQFSNKQVYKHLKNQIKTLNNKDFSIIECGCGSGYIQKKIGEKFNSQSDFLDISKEALKYTKNNLKKSKLKKESKFIQGSILSIPIKDNSYDIVWNSGVLEHFLENDQKKAFKEMIRITKTKGKTIILIPSTYGKIYLKMKKYAEKNGTWQAGYELPLKSMKHLIPKEYQNQYEEYSFGYTSQLHYLKYFFKNKTLIKLSIPILEILQNILFFLENKPGYFLIGIINKK